MRREDETFERDFANGDWVEYEGESGMQRGLILGFDSEDGQYWIASTGEEDNPLSDSPWECEWIDHEEPRKANPPENFGAARDHIFLVGTRSRVANVEAFADVETLVEAYPDQREHALLSLADPDEAIGDKTAVRFVIAKGAE